MEQTGPEPVAEAAERERDTARFVALFLLGGIMFSPLLMTIFDAPQAALFGIPLLYLYLFTVWAVLIALAARLSQSIGTRADAPQLPGPNSGDGG